MLGKEGCKGRVRGWRSEARVGRRRGKRQTEGRWGVRYGGGRKGVDGGEVSDDGEIMRWGSWRVGGLERGEERRGGGRGGEAVDREGVKRGGFKGV